MQAAIMQTHAWLQAGDELRMSCGRSVDLTCPIPEGPDLRQGLLAFSKSQRSSAMSACCPGAGRQAVCMTE